jgi:TolB-like protein
VTELVATREFTVIPEARVDALGVSVGGFGGGVDDRVASGSRRLGGDYGFAGRFTKFRVSGAGPRRVVTVTVTGRLIDAETGRRVWAGRVSRREPVAAKPPTTLRARAVRAVLPEAMETLATRLAASRP